MAIDLTTPAGLEAYLESTEYAAADVQTLSGGTLAFIYRVVLKGPLSSGETSVVVKHCSANAISDASMILGAERNDFEHKALKMIESSPLFSSSSVVQVPRVLAYYPETYTLIMTDLAPARLLSTILIECLESGDPTHIRQLSSQMGSALGDFIGQFHQWTSLPEQSALRQQFLGNRTSKVDALKLRYQFMLDEAVKFGLKQPWMDQMVSEGLHDAQEGGSVIAMADFWFNNMLVSGDSENDLRIYIIDWEMARCARPELDVGNFAMMTYSIANLYPDTSSFRLIQEFYKSYRKHFAVDVVQIALSCGTDVMSYGASAPWMADSEESALEAVTRAGVRLLEAAQEKDADLIKANVVLRDMYAVDTVVV